MAGKTAKTTKKTTQTRTAGDKNNKPRMSGMTAGIYGQVQGQTSGQNQQNQQNPQIMDSQVQQAMAGMDMLNQIDDMDEQTKVMQQEADNKEHDVEFMANKPRKTDLGIIGTEEIRKAYEILKGYQQEKADIEQRVQENEKFWKLNHWDTMQKSQEEQTRIEPKSAWLFNLIINKHADAMDNFPEANILPRAQDDEEVADILSDIIPVILEQNNYEDTYSDCQWYKCKNGTSVQGIFWDNSKNNGLGDVDIKKIDLLNIFWKGGITDIQDSPNFFNVTTVDNDILKDMYPDIDFGNVGGLGHTATDINYEQNVDTSNQTAVIDWYYKKKIRVVDEMGIEKTRTILHFCKFCNDKVIFASENDPAYSESGWYEHGMYPFVFDVLYPVEASVCGMGYIDVEKDSQVYIDKMQQAFLENTLSNATPRWLKRNNDGINEDEFLDPSKKIVHMEGDISENAIRQVTQTTLSGIYETVYMQKIQELKDTSGNTAASQGQASNTTSASGIASLQEAAGKLSRDSNTTSYRAYRKVVYMVIELIRQFYTEPRCFRITGNDGRNRFENFDNSMLLPQEQGSLGNGQVDLGSRMPILDIAVKPQKRSAYTKESQNQTALNLYSMGFFTPENADASLACLDMMDFEGIEAVREKVSQNGTLMDVIRQMQQQMQQLTAIIDAQNGTSLTEGAAGQAQSVASSNIPKNGGSIETSKGSLSTQAASATRGSTAPR